MATTPAKTPTTAAAGTPLADLADDFVLTLRAQNKAPATVKLYRTAVDQFIAYATAAGMPTTAQGVTREHVEAFIAHLLDTRSPSTAKTRYGGLQAFFGWCEEEGEVPTSPMARTRPPKVADQPVDVLGDDELRALLATCAGTTFDQRRDNAIIRLFIDTGMRRGELAGLTVEDIDAASGTALVLGKGGRLRTCPLGDKTTLAVRRYLRARAKHPHANATVPRPTPADPDARADALWLGKFGAMTDAGVQIMLRRRGDQAGIPKLHAHRFRHTFAHRWLANGGTEGDLMRLAGWRNRPMLDRYGRSVADVRARDAHRRMALGDQL